MIWYEFEEDLFGSDLIFLDGLHNIYSPIGEFFAGFGESVEKIDVNVKHINTS